MSQLSHFPFGEQDFSITFMTTHEAQNVQKYSEMEKTLRQTKQTAGLLNYGQRKEQITDISQSDSVEDEDALKLMGMICGGYVEDDFAQYLSYNDFQEKKEEFGVLDSIYQSIQKKYRNKKIEQSKIKFRSMLLMVFLEENISKLSRVRVEDIFRKNKIVW